MRLRNNPNAPQELLEHPEVFVFPKDKPKGKWHEIFKNNNPIHIEVGMGKGDFVCQMAVKNPDINYIGIEKYATVSALALKKAIRYEKPSNLRLMNIDADFLSEYFSKGEVDKVYLNFSDPWPKARHARRRLTNIRYIEKYKEICNLPCELELKTDNDGLYAYTLEHFEEKGIEIMFNTSDLHNGKNEKHITPFTEYETKFKNKGKNINKVIAKLK